MYLMCKGSYCCSESLAVHICSTVILVSINAITFTREIFQYLFHCKIPQSWQSARLFASRRNWDSPNPFPGGECPLPPWFRRLGHSRWRERGWESPNSGEGTHTVVLYMYMYIRTLCKILFIVQAGKSVTRTGNWRKSECVIFTALYGCTHYHIYFY
jgi:hypothetical protein